MEKRRTDADETGVGRHQKTQRQREDRRAHKRQPKPKTDKNRDGEANNHNTAERIFHSHSQNTEKKEKPMRDSLKPPRR